MAAIIHATDFGQALMGPYFQQWINKSAIVQMDVAAQDRRELAGE